MTISSESNTAGPFAGNGSTKAFPFAFKVFSTSELSLEKTSAAGVVTPLVFASDFGVLLNADQDAAPGGTITYPLTGAALAVGETLIVSTDLPYTQLTDITNAGGFLPQVVEDALDRNVRLMQQQNARTARSVRAPLGELMANLPPAAERANMLLTFDDDGDPVAVAAAAQSATQLAIDLASTADGKGTDMLGHLASGASAQGRNLRSKLDQDLPTALDRFSIAQIADVQARTRSVNVVEALQAALNVWAATPGGTLTIPAGDYYLGSYATSAVVLSCTPPRRGRISAYGARFIVTTSTFDVTPFIFKFTNPDGVVFEGGEFLDLGFDSSAWVSHDRQGAGGVLIAATVACDGFTLRDARAENVTYLIVSSNQATNRNLLRHINVIDCKVKMAYYGVDLIYAAQNVDIRGLECEDVRRGFISFGLKNATVDIKLKTNAGFLGSNAFISVGCEGEAFVTGTGPLGADGNVENMRIDLTVSGFEAHVSYVHLYHIQNDSAGSIKNIRANVMINNLSSAGKNALVGNTNIFLLDHELPSTALLGITSREFKDIDLSGGIIGAITGVPLKINSVNTSTPHTIALSPGLTAVTQTLAVNNLTTWVNWLSPFERPYSSLIPVGTTVGGVASGFVCVGSWTRIGRRVFVTAKVSWTGHTGTGFLRLSGLPFPVDTSITALQPLSVSADGLSHTAGATLVAFAGGTGNTQVVLLEESAGVLANISMDISVSGIYVTGSYLTP